MTVVDDHFVRRTYDWKFGGRSASFKVAQQLSLVQLLALFDCAVVHEDGDGRGPFLELVDPV